MAEPSADVLKKHPAPWRHGRSVGRTLYDANEVLIGLVDTNELALLIVTAVNASALSRPGDGEQA